MVGSKLACKQKSVFFVCVQIIDAANEVVGSVDVDELARFLLQKSEPEDEEAEVW